jgi:hypothetical protein
MFRNMKDKSTQSSTSKRGRKPIGAAAMTAAERKQISRRRLAADGTGEFMIRVGTGKLNLIDQFANANGVSRSQVVEAFLDLAFHQVAVAVTEAEQLRENGATDEEVSANFRMRFNSAPVPFAIDKYKEVMGIK